MPQDMPQAGPPAGAPDSGAPEGGQDVSTQLVSALGAILNKLGEAVSQAGGEDQARFAALMDAYHAFIGGGHGEQSPGGMAPSEAGAADVRQAM